MYVMYVEAIETLIVSFAT